jgi:ubiquinone/menaquinone biosynthesis C-methylase UbiE
MDIFLELHHDLPREAPGDNSSTYKAFSLLTDLPPRPLLLDIGCGPGEQTLTLAKATEGHIVAVDTYRPFLERLGRNAQEAQVHYKISPIKTSMFALPFGEQTFDVIWSEGAVYIVGFTEGLRAWRRFLKPRGYVAVSELAWLRSHPPAEAVTFWEVAYPAMRTREENSEIIRGAGYCHVGHFVLPAESWWKNYYSPLETRIASLREKYPGDVEANQQLAEAQQEIDLYRQYSDWYGYVFYVMQKA